MPKSHDRKSRKSKLIAIGMIIFILTNICLLVFNIYLLNNYKNYTGDCRIIRSQRVCTGAYDGLTEEQAVRKATLSGLKARVVSRDREMIIRTDDLNPNRVNFSIRNNIVIGTEFY